MLQCQEMSEGLRKRSDPVAVKDQHPQHPKLAEAFWENHQLVAPDCKLDKRAPIERGHDCMQRLQGIDLACEVNPQLLHTAVLQSPQVALAPAAALSKGGPESRNCHDAVHSVRIMTFAEGAQDVRPVRRKRCFALADLETDTLVEQRKREMCLTQPLVPRIPIRRGQAIGDAHGGTLRLLAVVVFVDVLSCGVQGAIDFADDRLEKLVNAPHPREDHGLVVND
mmetsp:Transcript_124186/g.277080  ORF Transcript_124186/g.277080 Transcript_124186/m.277080 type:complete len:224 (-) Transcript_124186:743-1414(-)